MKTNHIPVADRLRRRIDNLNAKIDHGEYWSRKRFYPKCKFCGITNVSSNMRDGAHNPGCHIPGMLKEIAYYRRLLRETETKDHESIPDAAPLPP